MKRLSRYRYAKLVKAVRDRDLSCRICGKFGMDWGHHVHHIKYRSLGGEDSMENCILLCPYCHSDEHDKRISITGTSDDLRIERR